MSDYTRTAESNATYRQVLDETESKLSLVIRKPQEGKTFICINKITQDTSRNIHVVLTMNTLAAGMQFFGRMEQEVGSKRIVVFNSKKKTAGGCWHAKTIYEVLELIDEHDIKVVVCCAHIKRFRDCLPKLFTAASKSIPVMQSNTKFVVHVDEAHKYIPENMEQIRTMNACQLVNEIIGYSASPDNIWSQDQADAIFHKILIRDVDLELNIIRTPNYYGVNRCAFHIYDDLCHAELIASSQILEDIPGFIYERAMMTSSCKTWLQRYSFDLGNEMLLFAFINHVLPILAIPQDSFSYNFVPAYTRKATHYQTVELILQHYPNANVIVSNGNNSGALYRYREQTQRSQLIKTDEMLKHATKMLPTEAQQKEAFKKLLEPSYLMQELIKDTPDCPTFVTGFTCVGMSVTLINSEIGNFDHVIMAHQHYSKDKIYQLCRFLFNYNSWSEESKAKIKTTQFHSLTQSVINTCLEYEDHIEKMSTDFAGKTCSLREIQGLEPEEPSEREIKTNALKSLNVTNPGGKLFKKFKVYEENDENQWAQAEKFYEEHMGKKLSGKSKPHLNEMGFWECSTTGHVVTHTTGNINSLEKQSWWSTFQLLPDRLQYARIFVGYENLEDPTEYTIYIKFVKLEDTENARAILQKYGKKTKKNEEE
jgi:hypothetical protein